MNIAAKLKIPELLNEEIKDMLDKIVSSDNQSISSFEPVISIKNLN
jgi:hypothetical protein